MSQAGALFQNIGIRSQASYSDRICPPEETIARVTPLFAKYGITRLARITGLDRIGIPVWNAIRPNAHSIAIYQGKGITDIDAKVSAAMEAFERAIAEAPGLTTRKMSIEQVRSNGLRYDPLDGLIGADHNPIGCNEPVDWVEAHEQGTGAQVLVPYDGIHLDRTRPNRFWQSSDGVASGNSEDEAIFHGLLERIERDAEVLWKLETPTRRASSAIDGWSLGDPVVSELLDRISEADFRLQLFEITSDIGIPVFSALLSDNSASGDVKLRYIDVTSGMGAHPIAARAAIRAITEAVQSRLTLISGARDDIPPDTYVRTLPDSIRAEIELTPLPWVGKSACEPARSLIEMTKLLLSRLEAVKIGRPLFVRLNPEEPRMAVVKILALGLENPNGTRRRTFGGRALSKLLVFR